MKTTPLIATLPLLALTGALSFMQIEPSGAAPNTQRPVIKGSPAVKDRKKIIVPPVIRTVPMPPRPKPPAPPAPPPPPPPPSGPRGMKVRIGGEIRVTNSEDGVFDNTVEMFGEVFFNGKERWRIKRSSAQDRKKGHVELIDYMNVDVYFNDGSSQLLKVSGTLRDRDIKGGNVIIKGDDDMWNVVPRDNTIMVDLKQMVENGTTRKTLYGDNNSENANVVIIVRKISNIN